MRISSLVDFALLLWWSLMRENGDFIDGVAAAVMAEEADIGFFFL
jgi:hypothetical protein